MNTKEWDKIVMDTLQEMYKKATPSASFSKVMQHAKDQKTDWYTDYYLSL